MKHILASALVVAAIGIAAQSVERAGDAPPVGERIRALQQEAGRLATESRTLVTELQQLEVERQLRAAEAQQADSERAAADLALQQATARLEVLERQRDAQLPDLRAQLVDLYKRGHGGYVRLLFAGRGIREFARTARAVAALQSLNTRRLADHQQTLAALRRERTTLDERSRALQARATQAAAARVAAERALAARTQLAARIDERRDLNAQYVGELQVAYDRLQQQLAPAPSIAPGAGSSNAPGAGPPAAVGAGPSPALGTAAPGADAASVSVRPFRGALEWPVAGTLTGRFGQTANRLGGAAVRNGIDIAAPTDTPVRAVHGGVVAFSGPYTGFGTLVIVDHGGNDYSLYGYLDSAGVMRGERVQSGAEIGRIGTVPGGMPALYFELRIDGRAVDPVEWLKAR